MEPLQGDTVTNDSCSCTTHDYNSESDCQTLIRLLVQGCRINRLFNGKYVPLRESKLLDRLIRTRALYDALRNELLSNSLSVSSTGNIKPGQDSTENTNFLEARKTGDIFALVNLVDKGAILGSRKLNVSCSCCNCNSKAHLHENMQKVSRNRQTHTGANMPSRSSVTSKQGPGEELKLGKPFKAKNIKSDPCTRAGKLEELKKLKLQSRTILKQNRPAQPQGRDQILTNTDKHKTLTNNEKMKISYHKLKRYKVGPTQYSENMGEGGIATIGKLKHHQDNLDLKKMSSIERLKIAQQKIKDSFIADLKATQQSKPEVDSIIKNNAFSTGRNPAVKFNNKVIGIDHLPDWELQKDGRILKKNDQAQNDGRNMNIFSPPNLDIRKEQYLIPGRTPDKRHQSPIRKGGINNPSHQNWELQKDIHIFKKNDQAQNDGRNVNISGPPNLGIRKEQYPIPGRIADKRHQSPIKKGDKNYPSMHQKGNKNAPSHQIGPKNYPLYQKRNKNDPLYQKGNQNEPSHLSRNKNDPIYQKGNKTGPLYQREYNNGPSHLKGNKNDPSHQKGKVISKTFNKVTHAIANSMKQEKPKKSDHLFLQDKKKSVESVKSNLDVPNEQYANHKRLAANQQKSPARKQNQNYTLDEKEKVTKDILKVLNNGLAVSIKQHKTKEARSNLDKRYNQQSVKSAKSMSSIIPNIGVRKEQFASPGRIATNQQNNNEQYANPKRKKAANLQKIPPRKQNKNDTLDEKEKVKHVKYYQISKSFHKVTRTITTSIKPQKPKESYPSLVPRDNKKSKSMTLLQSPEIVNKMEYPPLKEKPIKSKTRRKPGKLLNAISTTSIKKFLVENEDRNVHQTITKRTSLHLLNNKNKIKSDTSIQAPRSIKSPEAPMRFVPREHSSKKLPTQHEQKYLHQVPDAPKEGENDKQKKKTKKKNKQSKSHALKRCLCSLKIKVKKTKSALTKIVAGEIPQVKDKQSINTHDSKTLHITSTDKDSAKKSASGNALKSKYSGATNNFSENNEKIEHHSLYKNSLTLNDRKKRSINATNCECSDTDVHIKQKRGSNNELRQANTHSKTKLLSYDMTPKIINKYALDKTIYPNVASDCKCDSKEKVSIKYKKTNTPNDTKSTNHASTETKEKVNIKTHSVQTINTVNTKQKQSRMLHPWHKTNTTRHEKKSFFSHVTKCKCPFIKENIVVFSKKQKINDDFSPKPRFSTKHSKKAFPKDGSKISLRTQRVHKDSLILKNEQKMSTHVSKCECSDTDMNTIQIRGSETKLRQENTHSTNKSSSSHTTNKAKNHPIHINTLHKSTSQSLALRNRRKIPTSIFCECSNTSLKINQNSGSNYQHHQAKTHSTTNATTSEIINHPAHINTPNKTITLSAASECECFYIKDKVSLKYKQTNTHIVIKSTKHASTETKEKVNIQNHSVQTINTETIIEKQNQKLYPRHKTNTTHHETKSILSRVAKCKCPIAKKEKIIMPSKTQEMSDDYNSKPRFRISKNASIDRFRKSLSTDSEIKQTDLHVNKGSTKINNLHKQSKLSNSNDPLKYTSAKHGLRRCFCTLKLGKFDKKRNKLRKHFKGAISNTNVSKSEYSKTQPQVGISISTERREIYHREAVLSKREAIKLKKHKKFGKNRSNHSLTSQSMQLPRSQKISVLVSHKSEIPTNTTQQVRSSFATKFLHKNRPLATYSLIGKDSKLKRDRKTSAIQNHSLEKDEKRLQKSMRNLKRCLCTLKIHTKDKRRKKNIAVATDSKNEVEKMYPETKSPVRSPIDVGIETQKIKMRSKSSDTRKLPTSSNMLFINSDFKQRQRPLQKFRNLKKYTESHNRSKQNVELGSNFSFSIEFYKDVIPENKIIVKRLNNINVYFSNNSQEVNRLTLHDSVKSCLKPPKITLIQSVSKSSLTIKERRNNTMTPFIIKRPTPVHTMSTVTVAQTANLPDKSNLLNDEVKLGPRCVDSYFSNCTEKPYNRKKQLEYLKNRQISSVFSIAFKSKKIQSYVDDGKCNLLQINSLNQSLLDFTSKETVRFESKLGYKINYEENVRFNKRPILRSTYSEIDSFAQKQDEQKVLGIQQTEKSPIITNDTSNPPKLTGIQPFLKKSYCTMNVQVAQQSPKRRHHQQYPRKLKDYPRRYECEPGVCIPYECDPNECQKMIMKRLMRNVSRMSGTENRMKTSSSATSSIRSSGRRTRKLQSNSPERHYRDDQYRERRYYRPAKVRHTGLKYQTLPRSPIKHRQAVRVGSNFSFNMEFSKGSSKSAPTAEFIKEPIRPSTTRSSKTLYRRQRDRGTGYDVGRHHRESQSRMKQMRHRASSVTPMLRRCFCTLKLQKRGRQQKERELEIIHQGTSTPPKFYVDKPILRTTETSQNTKVRRRFPELLPYECEPNVCVPGECDPYECLERIKKRRGKYTRDLGTDSMKSNVTSSSSMTSSQRRTRRRYVQARNLNQTRSRDTAVRSKPTLIESQVSPTKQAVRISSSFSFNVEFFKDKTSPTDNIDMRSPEIHEHRTPRHVRKVPKHVYVQHKMRESSSQDRKSTRDTHSQMGFIKHGQSTMTGGFLKRCFCTAKLQGVKVDTEQKASQNRTSFSTMKRCLCHLKSLTTKKEPNKTDKKENEQITPLIETHVGKTQTRAYSPVLEPYECEPGVCVPGLCDPYECEKRIRKRRVKEKMAGTTRLRTKSTSSSISSSDTLRARMTQSKRFRQYERHRRRHLPPRDIVVRDRTPVLPQKQVVKIGSNFSFNIELYKGNMPNMPQVQTDVRPVRKPRPTRDQAHEARYRYKTKDRRLMGRTSSVYTRGSQMDATKTKDQSLGPILKRCFCTLKLLNKEKYIRKEKQINQGTATPAMKEVPTLQSRSVMTIYKYKPQPYKLKPYECEPGVCVPGECDPFECDKRIKRRLMHRASGTLTDRHGTRSTASTIRPYRRYRDRDSQSMRYTRPARTRDIQYRSRRPEIKSKVVERASKHAVNIGSNFSFNMEFFKDKSPGSSVVSSRQKKYYDSYRRPRRTASRSTEWQSSSRNKKAQHYSTMRDMDSQVFARKMRSTMTGVGPFLKRCFCTLQLHKSEIDKKPFNKPESVSTNTENFKSQPKVETRHEKTSTPTRSPVQFQTRKLEPYECEPGVCVPGECDPYECEKRIKRRLMLSKKSSTDPHRGRSVSSSIGESAKSRHRRIQALSSTPSGERGRFRGEDHVPSTGGSPDRQVVRIGSSFSFNVEFYKDQSPQLPSARDVTKIIKRGYKGTETQYTNRPRNTSSYSRRPRIRHCQSQSDCVKTDCKSSCAPLLKRCFCTLKLQKMGKQEQDNPTKGPTLRTMGTLTPGNKVEIIPVAREIGTKTKKYTHPLEPYECEPGVCVPGLCDPYECEKLIKQRNMKDFATETTRSPMKSMYTLTSRDMGIKAINTYRSKNRNPHTEPVYKIKKSPRIGNLHRQSVHLGSNFSFNVEFFKDRGGMHHDDIQTYYKPRSVRTGNYKSKTSMSTANRIKLRNQGSRAREKSLYHRQLQAGAQTESRGSGMGALKRCFCTLTLQRAEVKNNLSSPVAKSTTVSTQDKKNSTKKYTPTPVPLQLEPYECEPYVCTPGECDPYDCLERIKKRGIRRMSRTTGTRMKRTSQVSASSMAAQFMPGYTSKRTQFKTEGFSPQKVERIVEEPRFSFLNGNPNRQGVKISSNFSFNVEFYKEASTPRRLQVGKKTCRNKEICQVKDACTKCKKTGHTTSVRVGKNGTRNYLHNNESQSDSVKTEDKSSAAAMLRRCFCTAKLHRSHLARSHYPQSLTVGRVQEIRPLFGPKEYWVQYQILPSKNTRSEITKDLSNIKSSGAYKLETIMSYTPRKFIKNNDPIEQSSMGKKTGARTSSLRKMLKCCKNLFVKRNNQNEEVKDNPTEVNPSKQPKIDFLKPSKSERHPENTATSVIKKTTSLKVAKTRENEVYKSKYSRFESGDANHGYTAGFISKNGIKFVKKTCPNCHVQFNQQIPLKQVHFALSPKVEYLKSVMKPPKESKSVSFLYKSSTFKKSEKLKCSKLCSCCGGFKREKILLSPDFNTTKFMVYNALMPKEIRFLPRETREKHKSSCPCCACRKRVTTEKRDTNVTTTEKQHPNVTMTENQYTNLTTTEKQHTYVTTEKQDTNGTSLNLIVIPRKNRFQKRHPCVCGSIPCKKEAEKLADEQYSSFKKTKTKKCVCGTDVCATESKKEELVKESGYIRARKKKREQKNKELEAKMRDMKFKKEDKEIMKMRKRNDKYMMKKLKKYKETSDVMLLTESLLDICKLGITSLSDILRNLGRTVIDPKRTYRNLLMAFREPMRTWKKFQDAANHGPVAATLKRIKLRCQAITCTKRGPEKLESHPVTNYLLHANDKDPRRRLNPKKIRQPRRDAAFGCSPFLLSLRKRPWLCVYYTCTWFYPHCLSLLQVWRQFMDVILFLLAVAVLSPCIMCMELSRALMCCFLCTG